MAIQLPVSVLAARLDETPKRVSPGLWSRVRSFVLEHVQGKHLRPDDHGLLAGLPADCLSQWFSDFVDTQGPGGQPYSERRRRDVHKVFEVVRERWQPALAAPLTEVRTVIRTPRRSGVDWRILLTHNPDTLERLRMEFARELASQGIVQCGEVALERGRVKFFNCVFAFITFTGAANPDWFSNFCRLQVRHLSVTLDGEVRLPRSATGEAWLPMAPDTVTRLCLHARVVYRMREHHKKGARRRQVRPLAPEAYLCGLEPNERNVARLRREFNGWLRELCVRAGVPMLTYDELARLAQVRLVDLYSAEVIETLTGRVTYDPLVPDQAGNLLDEFLGSWSIPAWAAPAAPPSVARQPRHRASPSAPAEDGDGPAWPKTELDDQFFKQCREFAHERETAAQCAERLRAWARELLDSPGDTPEACIRSFYDAHLRPALAQDAPLEIEDVQRYVSAVTAAWLARQLLAKKGDDPRLQNAHTFHAYCDMARLIARETDGNFFLETGYPTDEFVDAYETSAGQVKATDKMESRTNMRLCVRSLRRFLRVEIGLKVEAMETSRRRRKRSTEHVRLVRPAELERLLTRCVTLANQSRDNDGRRRAQCVYLALLLGNFAGLRAVEMARLRISHVVMRGLPYLVIRLGKRGKPRFVPLDLAPPAVLDALRAARDMRWKATGDLADWLLPFPDIRRPDGTLTPPSDLEKIQQLSKWVGDLMRSEGLKRPDLPGSGPTLHRLRANYINWTFAVRQQQRIQLLRQRFNGQDSLPCSASAPVSGLLAVARYAGHATARVTQERYLHIQNALQARQLRAWEASAKDGVYQAVGKLKLGAAAELADLKSAQIYKLLRPNGQNGGSASLRQSGKVSAVEFLDILWKIVACAAE